MVPRFLPATTELPTLTATGSVYGQREKQRHMLETLATEDSPHLLDNHGPLFIVGCPRSGTTFLSQCISAIDCIEEFVGAIAPPRLMHLIGSSSAAQCECRHYLLLMRDIFWQAFWRRRLQPSERLFQILQGKRSITSVLRPLSLDGAIFCYKEPFLCFAVDQVAAHFSNSKFIHIIRDGRDNADSLERTYPHALTDTVLSSESLVERKSSEVGVWRMFGNHRVPWWVEEGADREFVACSAYGRYIWMWKEMVTRAIKTGTKLGNRRYLEVRYEEAVSSPAESARRIVDFLGVDVDRRLLRALHKARRDSVGIGRRRQVAEHLLEAKQIAGDLFDSLGYDS
jgi:hypothetical protein